MQYMFKTPLVSQIPDVISCPNAYVWDNLYIIKKVAVFEMVEPIKDLKPYTEIERCRVWRPKDVIEYAIKHNLKVGLTSYDAIVRYWITMVKPVSIFSMFGELPTYDEYTKVILEDNGSLNRCKFTDEEWGRYTVIKKDDDKTIIYTCTNLNREILSKVSPGE